MDGKSLSRKDTDGKREKQANEKVGKMVERGHGYQLQGPNSG